MVGKRVPAAYSAPPIPESVLRRVKAIGITNKEIKELSSKDKVCTKLRKEIAELEASRPPTRPEINRAWAEALRAYWTWINLAHKAEETAVRKNMVKNRLARRMIELRKSARARKIHMLKLRMGPKFWRAPTIGVGGVGKGRPPSSKATSPAPSASPKEILDLPPAP